MRLLFLRTGNACTRKLINYVKDSGGAVPPCVDASPKVVCGHGTCGECRGSSSSAVAGFSFQALFDDSVGVIRETLQVQISGSCSIYPPIGIDFEFVVRLNGRRVGAIPAYTDLFDCPDCSVFTQSFGLTKQAGLINGANDVEVLFPSEGGVMQLAGISVTLI